MSGANGEPFCDDGSEGMIFNIQRFSLQDGPGIRTTVFFKGCPLRCRWCSNPESQSREPEILFRENNCRACGTCADTCPIGAIEMIESRPRLNRSACNQCMDCVNACPGGALEVSGHRMSVEAVLDEVSRDEMFYGNSGGGVTLSGGEPLAQPEFARRLLQGCRARGLRTALDTCGCASRETLQRLLEYTDLVLFDLKHLDPGIHRQGTHADNTVILENLKNIVAGKKNRVWIRIPVIPGFNDTTAYFRELAAFCSRLPVEKVSLLGYHQWGKTKYEALGRLYPMGETAVCRKEKLEALQEILTADGIHVTVDH